MNLRASSSFYVNKYIDHQAHEIARSMVVAVLLFPLEYIYKQSVREGKHERVRLKKFEGEKKSWSYFY